MVGWVGWILTHKVESISNPPLLLATQDFLRGNYSSSKLLEVWCGSFGAGWCQEYLRQTFSFSFISKFHGLVVLRGGNLYCTAVDSQETFWLRLILMCMSRNWRVPGTDMGDLAAEVIRYKKKKNIDLFPVMCSKSSVLVDWLE